MSITLALLVVVAAPPASSPPPSDEIVVIGERMRRLRLETRTDRRTGVRRCIVKRASGDERFDALMCTASLDCAARITTRDSAAFRICMAPTLDAYVAELRARRRATTSPPS